jgi:glucose 1-dehydrogenase
MSNKHPEKVILPSCKIHPYLKGQKAIVTGANTGIGKAVAISLAQSGADVCINYFAGEKEAQEVVKTLKSFGVNAMSYKADVSKEEEVVAMFKKTIEEFGTVDILVSNAGIQRDAPFDEMTLQQWNAVIGTNLTGQFLCCKEAVKEFKRRGVVESVSCSSGKIICMSSVHQVIPWAGHVNYATSKGGIEMMMKSIAQELAPKRIRVNCIAPGAIKTHINEAAWSTSQAANDLLKLIPYHRIGDAEDIGKCAAWLASDQSDYITGSTIFVDGGMTLYPGFSTGG